MKDSLIIKNCLLYNTIAKNELIDILIEGRAVSKIGKINEINNLTKIIDAGGRIVCPGFIDVHIQGAGGCDILDNNIEALEIISRTLAKSGTTSFLATTVIKLSINNQHLGLVRKYVGAELGGASLLGLHLEGPFINIKMKGGISKDSISEPSFYELDKILAATGNILKIMTIAPELPGNLEIIKRLKDNNIIAAFAHSDATYEETKKGIAAGISNVTHIFNTMPPLHHRQPGPLAAIFENDDITAQIISDGYHIHPSLVKLVYKIFGESRCICITDGMMGMGLPEGRYIYNGKEYESRNGVSRYLDGTLIGSTLSLKNIALKFMEFSGCSFEEAINSVTINPAKLLGIENKKGSINIGMDADFVLLDNDFSIYMTIIMGRKVYQK